MPVGVYACVVPEISPGIGTAMRDGTRIPRVTWSWLRPPRGPAISTGAKSLSKLGLTTENAPPAIPWKNLAIAFPQRFNVAA